VGDRMDIEKQIIQLREKGKKLFEISKITGKSIHFVYSRLNPKYQLGQLEIDYINSKVIPYLKKRGLRIIPFHFFEKRKDFWGDIIAKKGNTYHIFEVKRTSQNSTLCFAIGEIIISRMNNEQIKGKKKYHIILPHSEEQDEVMKNKSKFLKKEYNMDIILI